MTDDELNVSDRPAVIVGSGFSRAIALAMPTMPELGELVLDRLDMEPEVLAPFGGNLEQWMSYLSIDQPWLTPAENYTNRGMFARVSDAIYACITLAESSVIEQEIPIWLQRLAWTWCDQRASVFSFNYDTLLERAVGTTNRITTLGDLYAAPLTDRFATGDGGGMFATAPPLGNLLSLFKLHGSTSWAFGGLDGPSNDRLVLWNPSLRWVVPVASDQPEPPRRVRQYDDLVPLIIPPTLTKGPFFSNLALRAQWRRAAEALKHAQRLTVIGYSFPPADLVAQQWVGTTFDGVRMDVIDRAEGRPAAIRATLANARQGQDLTGDKAIQEYVNRECGDHVAWRIWVDGEGEGVARASVVVNGVINMLEAFGAHHSPWGSNSVDDARAWLHPRIDAAGGNHSVEHAVGGLSAAYEERQVVLPVGKHLIL